MTFRSDGPGILSGDSTEILSGNSIQIACAGKKRPDLTLGDLEKTFGAENISVDFSSSRISGSVAE